MFNFAYLITLAAACQPIASLWSDNLHPKCIHLGIFLFTCSCITTFLELVMALLPLPVILNLRLDKRQRWSVVCLLSLGVLTAVVGCVRTYFVYKALVVTLDVVWWAEPHWIASEVENAVALVSLFRFQLESTRLTPIGMCLRASAPTAS
jgi:hypothetical protein